MNRCLVTGCEGFIGSYLARYLLNKGLAVYGTAVGSLANLEHIIDRIQVYSCDISDREQVQRVIAESKPDYVFHLAAQSLIGPSWEDPEGTLRVNMFGTMHLLDSIKVVGLDPVIEVVGSSAEYGVNFDNEIPIVETKEFRPSSFYGVSKIGEDMVAYLYWRAYGMKVIRIRPFYVTGPGKTGDVCSDFARRIVEIERGTNKVFRVGNLESVRDLVDISDAIEAMWLLIQEGEPGEVYNLCSGTGVAVSKILEQMVSFSSAQFEIVRDPDKMRPSDDPVLIGDNSKLCALGWKPLIPLERTLSDVLDFWRATTEADIHQTSHRE